MLYQIYVTIWHHWNELQVLNRERVIIKQTCSVKTSWSSPFRRLGHGAMDVTSVPTTLAAGRFGEGFWGIAAFSSARRSLPGHAQIRTSTAWRPSTRFLRRKIEKYNLQVLTQPQTMGVGVGVGVHCANGDMGVYVGKCTSPSFLPTKQLWRDNYDYANIYKLSAVRLRFFTLTVVNVWKCFKVFHSCRQRLHAQLRHDDYNNTGHNESSGVGVTKRFGC